MQVEVRSPPYSFNFRQRHVSVGGMSGASLRRVIEYIEMNFSSNVRQRALASIAGLSVRHFGTVFKIETGMTPHNFLIRRRIVRAKDFLTESDLTIAQIANEVGFSGQSHLTLYFRRYTGTTPQRFRRVRE
jgi:AraC family transcriptional regulator